MTTSTILYVVDPQIDFMNPNGALYVPDSAEIIPNMVEAIKEAKELGLDIYISSDRHNENSPEFSKNGGDFPFHCMLGSQGAGIVPEIQAALDGYERVHMLYKDGIDIWKESGTRKIFDDIIKEHIFPQVIIMGVATDFCVKKAVKGFAQSGWSVTIFKNCVKGVNARASKQFMNARSNQDYKSGVILEICKLKPNLCSMFSFYTEEHVESIVQKISKFIIEQVIDHKKEGVVIGLSGGMDSTLVASLAKWAFMHWPPSRVPEYKVVGLSIPTALNAYEDASDAHKIADSLGIEFHTISLENTVKAATLNIPDPLSPYDRGNMISRLRANALHTYAAQHNLLVLGTGNKDEDYGVGYYTLFGDGAVHCSPIGDVSKRMVKILLKEFGKRFSRIIEEIANKEPMAGLENNQTDFKDLGYSYEFVELCTWRHIRGFKLRMIEQFNKDHERAQALGCVKFDTWKEAVADYSRRHKIAIMKSKLVNPPICFLKGVE